MKAPPGVRFLWSLAEVSECERTQVDRLQMFLTRDAFRDIAPLLDNARGSVLDTPLGRLLGDYMLALERRLPSLTTADLPALAKAVGAMVAAVIEPTMDRFGTAQRQIDLAGMERVRQAVRLHLRSPELGPRMLCRLVGLSRSHLYRLFEHRGGVARYIRDLRLLEAHKALCDTAVARSISRIAEDLCFADASSFSRAFRREFGYSPTDVHAAAMAGLAPSVTLPFRAKIEAADFTELLRGF